MNHTAMLTGQLEAIDAYTGRNFWLHYLYWTTDMVHSDSHNLQFISITFLARLACLAKSAATKSLTYQLQTSFTDGLQNIGKSRAEVLSA